MQEISKYSPVTLAPGISLYEGVVEDSQEIIDLALSLDGWRESTFFTYEDTHKEDKDIRDTRILDLPYHLEGHVFSFILAKMFYDLGKDYSERWQTGFHTMESPQLLHYTAGEGHYNAHADAGPGTPRIFSSILYLNDVEEGGDTYFPNFDVSIPPKAGSVAMFPAEYVYVHEARPPISGDKFAAVTWFRPWINRPGEHNHG